MKLISMFAGLSLLFLSVQAAAEPVVAPQIHVDATPLPYEERLYSPQPQTLIKRDALDNQPSWNAGDILKRMPGVFTGGPIGEDKDVRFRGLDKEFTRVRVDGFTLPDPGEKREFQVDRLPAFMVEEIRIIRNPTAEYESDGIAGQVDIITRPIPHKVKFDARLGYGGFDSLDGDLYQGSLALGGRPVESFGILGILDVLHDDKTKEKRKVFSTGKVESDIEDRITDYRNVKLDFGFFYDAGELHIKPLLAEKDEQKSKSKFNLDPGKNAKRDDEQEAKDVRTSGVELVLKHQSANNWRLENQLGFHHTSEDKDKIKWAFEEQNAGAEDFVLKKTELEQESKEDQTVSFSSKIIIPLDYGLPQEVRVGMAARKRDRFRDKAKQELQNNGNLVERPLGAKDIYNLDEHYFATFVQNELWLSERFSVMPGVRLEHVRLDVASGSGEGIAKSSRTDLNPSLHVLYALREDLSLRAAVSRGVNRPKFDELSPFEEEKGDRFVIGNPDLNPAVAWKYDVGADFARRNIFLGVNLFYQDIEGVIEEVNTGMVRDGKDIYSVRNVGNGWNAGIELEQRLGFGWARTPLLSGLMVWANQTLLDSELKEADGTKRPFKDQPDYILNLGADYTYKPWGTTLSLAWHYVDGTVEVKPTGDRKVKSSQSVVDAGFYQRLTRNSRLFFEVQNLTDKAKKETETKANGETSIHSDKIGRRMMAGLEVKF